MAERGGVAWGAEPDAMRIDLFLWHVRLAKSRSVAQALVGEGHVRLDGRRIERAATPVRIGNILTFPHGNRVRVIRIEALPRRRGPAPEAQACYQELTVANVSHQARDD